MTKKQKGNAGEDLAFAYLKHGGYIIIERNFRTEIGEIDIVAADDGCLVFVEVKVRKNGEFGYAADAVNRVKQKRMIQTASQYLAKYMIENQQVRFDIIEIYIEDGSIEHIKNAFDSYLNLA